MGQIITFYSYKGGVGRSMALANVATLLVQWGYKTLVVDWDFEAPGIENFFINYSNLKELYIKKGMVDLLRFYSGKAKLNSEKLDWHDLLAKVKFLGNIDQTLHLIVAGEKNSEYYTKVREWDVQAFYDERDGGEFIENLRNEWKNEYDFVLIDSRTGVTDTGGICTIQLPDILVVLFVATEQAFEGAVDIANKACGARQNLPYTRQNLLTIPIAARFETLSEYKISEEWLDKFANGTAKLYENWIPRSFDRRELIKITKIPYKSYFSFGEKLPVIEEGTKDPTSLGYSYEILTTLIANKLDYVDILQVSRDKYVGLAKGSDIVKGLEIFPWNVPFPQNPNFIGREEEMDNLKATLELVGEAVIEGMGGVGKTQLAVEYCHRYKGEYPGGVMWVRAEKNVLEEYGLLGDELDLNLPATLEVDKQCREVRRKLEHLEQPGLVVLDNLDDKADYAAVREYLPTTGSCRLLVTSRRGDLIPGDGVSLDVLPADEALDLLLRESGRENEDGAGERICRLLGYLPLGLEMAGRYLERRRRITFKKYADRLQECGALDHRSQDGEGSLDHTDHIASLKATLRVNTELVNDSQVQPVLTALTCFTPESIDQGILGLICGLEEEALEEVIAKLEDYSLIQVQTDNRLSIHRLMREALVAQLPDESKSDAQRAYVTEWEKWSPICNDVTKLKLIAPEVPHLIQASKLADKLDIWPQSFELAINLGNYYYNLGRYQERLKWLTPLQSRVKDKHPQDKPRLALLFYSLGETWDSLGKYDKAIEFYQQALSIDREFFGDRHPDVAIDLNNLGETWRALGEYTKAINYYEQALSIWKEVYGERHPQVAIGLNNLGEAWRALGEYTKAIRYYEQALSIDKETYGEQHPEIAIRLNNLGSAWDSQGEYKKAINFYEQALSIDKETYGEQHPNVAIRLNNLGSAWDSLEEYTKARQYYQQAYSIKLEFLGEDHPSTKITKKNLAALPG